MLIRKIFVRTLLGTFAFALGCAEGSNGTNGSDMGGGSSMGGSAGVTGTTGGAQSVGGFSTGGTSMGTGGSIANGGSGNGGGDVSSGGDTSSGGVSTGGDTGTGGTSTGGTNTGGTNTGGTNTGGTNTGGTNTGGTNTGGTNTGGTNTGGTGGCTTATVEGETMTPSATGVGQVQGTYFDLWANGSLSTTANLAGAHNITVYAAGTAADGSHNPHLIVEVNGTAIGNTTVTPGTTFNPYVFNYTGTGSQTLTVRFDNDFYDSTTGADTNLYVDRVVIGCGTSSGTGGTGGTGTGGTGTGGTGTGGTGTGGTGTGGTGGTVQKFCGNITTNGQVRSDFITYWDQITPENEGKWGSVEGTRDVMNWSGLDRVHDYAKQHNIPFKQHNFVWGAQQPGWIGGLSAADQRAEVEEWIRLFCERYPDTALIDVVNEPPPHTTPVYMNALGGAGSSGYDWIVQTFKWARQYCPKAILILNDYNTIEYTNDNNHIIDIVNRIRTAGAPIDAIGAQAHAAYGISTSTVQGYLQKLEGTGLPVYITEYDINLADDTAQLNVMKSQFPMFWTDPKVHGVTLWGYIVGSTWVANSGLMTSSGQMRPAMTWLMQYLGR